MNRPTRRLPLTALRTFEAAARHLSFKQAADELCVSATTVSNQIRQLEKDWNCKLFHRHTRAVSLTEKGQSLATVLTSAFTDIRGEIDKNIAPRRQTVTIAVGPIFGSRWLAPRLARFARLHPGIELVVHHGTRINSADQLHTDLAVDWGVGKWRNLHSVRLMEIRYSPIISPELARDSGALTTPADLTDLTIIHQHDRSEWENWFALAGYPEAAPENEMIIVDSNMVQRTVKDGQGVALGVFPFMDPEVKNGQLIKPFDIDLAPDRAFHLLAKQETLANKAVQTVWNWIKSEAHAGAEDGSGGLETRNDGLRDPAVGV